MSFVADRYACGLLQANEAERTEITIRLEAAFSEAKRVAIAIKSHDPAVLAVILFGSVARKDPSNLSFDIDIALDGGDTYKAMDITETSPFDIDVVSLNLLPDHVRKGILEYGIVL